MWLTIKNENNLMIDVYYNIKKKIVLHKYTNEVGLE